MESRNVDNVLKGLNTASVVLPSLIDLVVHYKEISNSGELKETDKVKMKENLDQLSLPDWDTI